MSTKTFINNDELEALIKGRADGTQYIDDEELGNLIQKKADEYFGVQGNNFICGFDTGSQETALLNAGDINAKDINAEDIKAEDVDAEKEYSNIIIKAVEVLLKSNSNYKGVYSLSAIDMIEELIKDSKEKDKEYRALNFLRQELSNEGLEQVNFDEIAK